jgi:Uma2 family endonuclease
MASATQISIAEYLSTTYRPDCDYVDGEVQERNLGEYEHARAQTRFAIFIGVHEKDWRVRVVTEQRVQVKTSRFRVPDVCVVLEGSPIESIFRHPPFLCVEILSKDDSFETIVDRLDDYLAMGVPNIWVIDPRTRRGYRYTAAGFLTAQDGILRTSDPELSVPLQALFD